MKGVVVKQLNVGEGDRLIWVFTPEYGIIKASGRGASRVRGKNSAGSQLLCYSEFEIFPGRDIHTINRAEPIDSFAGIQESITKLALASYFCECVYCHMGFNNADENVYRLFMNCIYSLSHFDIKESVIKAVFEFRLMCDCGYRPVLECCIDCGDIYNISFFDYKNGGLLCRDCRAKHTVNISDASAAAMRYIAESPVEKIFSFSASEVCIRELANASEKYLISHTDILPKGLTYYKKVSGCENKFL